MAFSPDGKQIASQCDADIVIWDLADGGRRRVESCGDGCAMSLAFSPNGAVLAASVQL